ncbi:MAG: antibiotic biosynthesis monooxygenase [Ilumatobacteraceae bacterium]
MIIIFAGTIALDPEERDRYIQLRLEPTARYRAMVGTLHYSITADAVDPTLVNVFECYESEEALEAHRAVHTPNTEVPVRSYDLYRYEATRAPLNVG